MSEALEVEILQQLVLELEADGYQVLVHPNRMVLPAFLSGLPPDAVAFRSDSNLVIEVVGRSAQAKEKLDRMTAAIAGQPKWKLKVVWIETALDQAPLQVQSRTEIESRIAEIRVLAGSNHTQPAFLLAWATFEALARSLASDQFGRAQTPGRLMDVLARNGYLTPTEADRLRPLADRRNKLIHGDLQATVSKAEMDDILTIFEVLLQQLPAVAGSQSASAPL